MDGKQLKKVLTAAVILFAAVNLTTNGQLFAQSTRVVVCYRGKSLLITTAQLQSYLDRGAVQGACVVTECQNR